MPEKKKALIADDDRLIRRLLQNKLSQAGYEVSEVTSGKAAIAHLERETPDCVLLDVMMPGMSGHEVLEWIRSQGAFKDLPVIMLTGNCADEDVKRSLDLGATGHMTKPFKPNEIVSTLNYLLKRDREDGSGVRDC